VLNLADGGHKQKEMTSSLLSTHARALARLANANANAKA
jgi:hypothetical protein